MNVRLLLLLLVFGGALLRTSADELRQRPLAAEIERYLKAEKPPHRDLCYLCSRATALLTAYSGTLQATATTDAERDLAAAAKKRAVPFYQVAMAAAIAAHEPPEATPRRIFELVELYLELMTRTRNLNQQSISAPIQKDLDALRSLEPLVLQYAERMDR
jgi:hypothetical protein